jgi:hypothetical protein
MVPIVRGMGMCRKCRRRQQHRLEEVSEACFLMEHFRRARMSYERENGVDDAIMAI